MQLAVVNLSIIHSYKDYSRIAVIFELQVKEKNVLSLQEEQRCVKFITKSACIHFWMYQNIRGKSDVPTKFTNKSVKNLVAAMNKTTMKTRICEIQFYHDFNIAGVFRLSWRAVEIPACCVVDFVSNSSCGHSCLSCFFLHHSFQFRNKLCAGNDFLNGYAAGRPVQHQDNVHVLYDRVALLFGIFGVYHMFPLLGNHKSGCG